LDEGFGRVAIIIDLSKAFDLVPHDRLFTKMAASCLDSRERDLVVGQTQRVRLGGQLSKEVKVISGAPQGSVVDPLLFLIYVNDIWRNIDSSMRLFADGCKICRKISNKNDIEILQKHLDNLREWAVENGMKIDPGKSKAITFTRAPAKNQLGYTLGDKKIPEANNCKYSGIILGSDLNWVDQVNYTALNPGRQFTLLCVVSKQEIGIQKFLPKRHW
jgi:hypothetical protein